MHDWDGSALSMLGLGLNSTQRPANPQAGLIESFVKPAAAIGYPTRAPAGGLAHG